MPPQANRRPRTRTAAVFCARLAPAAPAIVRTAEVPNPHQATVERFALKALNTPMSPMPEGPISTAISLARRNAIANVTA